MMFSPVSSPDSPVGLRKSPSPSFLQTDDTDALLQEELGNVTHSPTFISPPLPSTFVHTKEGVSKTVVLVNQISFVLTGVASTLLAQLLYNEGAGVEGNGLVVWSMYGGMALARFIPLVHASNEPRTWFPQPQYRGIMAQLSSIDLIGNVIITLGLFWVGSGIYQVIYASIVVFAALLLRIVLPEKKGLNRNQWVGIITVTLGLALSGFGAVHSIPADNVAKLLMGVAFCIVGTICYALIYVFNERNFSHIDPPDPVNVCGWIGSICSLAFSFWFVFVTVPRWHELVTLPIEEAKGNTTVIIFSYIALILDQFLHNYNYYVLIDCTGAVTTGVLQSLRSILVFLLSAYFFCENNQEQCLNVPKILSCIVVVGGVMWYSVATAKLEKEKEGIVH